MLTITTVALLYHLLSSLTPVNGQLQLARRLEPRPIDKRSSFQGGWALLSSTCAANEVACTQSVNAACCPSGTVCDANSLDGAVACCPDQNLCNSQVLSAPSCANSSWTLWQGSNIGGTTNPFCCLPNQIGVNPEDASFAVGSCVANNVVLPSSKSATSLVQIGAQTGSGSTPSTSSVSTTATQSSTATYGNPSGSSSASTSGPSGSPTASSSASKSGLSGGAIGGIVAGVVVGIVLVALVGFLCYRQGQRGNGNRGIDPMHQDPSSGDQKVWPTGLKTQEPRAELTAEVPRAEMGG